jgi:hypothetical protein
LTAALRGYLSSLPATGVRVGIVLVGYSAEDAHNALRHLDRWSLSYPGESRACVVLNRTIHIDLPPGWESIRGSNAAHEFSGFDEGIDHLRDLHPEVWLLCNDRLLSYEQHYLGLVSPAVLRIVGANALLVGHVNHLSVPVARDGHPLGAYVRTNLICLGEKMRARLGQITTHRNDSVDELFAPEWPLEDSSVSAKLASEWLAYIAAWLTSTGGEPSTHWYKATRDPSRSSQLRLKAVAIANEHLLSDRVKHLGGQVVSVQQATLLAPFLFSPRRLSVELSRIDSTRSTSRRDSQRLALLGILHRAWHTWPRRGGSVYEQALDG